ncbi:portal protein, partial [Ammoniphilus sp. YIM 78166]|uniref:portal protein n=1 Tax=Ammoniphilus sp. YIM 78166 TaxID=1644106 RepID=UPI00196A7CCC
RVTAYEIRQTAQEAQNALGDAYSTLADNWLRKLAYLYIINKYPEIKPMLELGAMELDVTVGTASLYKSAQADRLLEAVQSLQLIVPVLQQATARTNVDALIDSVMDSFGIQSSSFFYTEEELQARQQAQQAQQAQDQQ